MKNILVLTLTPINGGAEIVKKFPTNHEYSLLGYHAAMVEALPELEKEGFIPFFYYLDGGLKLAARGDWENPNRGAMMNFQNFNFQWEMEEI